MKRSESLRRERERRQTMATLRRTVNNAWQAYLASDKARDTYMPYATVKYRLESLEEAQNQNVLNLLDEDGNPIGTIKALGTRNDIQRKRHYPKGGVYGENWSTFAFFKVSSSQIDDEVVGHNLWEITNHSCNHSNDCCGCIFTYAGNIKKVSRRVWLVEINHGINC